MKLFSIAFLGLVASNLALAGGVSGGGGNSKPANPVTSAEVTDTIRASRQYVAAYFNHLELVAGDESRWPGHKNLPAKLFNGTSQAVDWVLKLPIHIEEKGPCLDPAGKAMDGSAIANPPQVCLSLPRLVKKLSRESLRVQVIALAIHEYSHLVGSTEIEADFLQTAALDNLLTADFVGLNHTLKEAWSSAYRLQEFAGGGAVAPPESPEVWAQLRDTLKGYRFASGQYIFSSPSGNYFMPWSSRLREFFLQTISRFELMEIGACVKAGGEDAAECQGTLDKFFGTDEEIDYRTYLARSEPWQHGPSEEHPGVFFRRVRSIPDVQLELTRLKLDADYYVEYIRNMKGY